MVAHAYPYPPPVRLSMRRQRDRGQTRRGRDGRAARDSEEPPSEIPVFGMQTQAAIRWEQGIAPDETQPGVPAVVTQTYTTRMYPMEWTGMPPPEGEFGETSEPMYDGAPGYGQVPMQMPTRIHGSSAASRARGEHSQHTVPSQEVSARTRIMRMPDSLAAGALMGQEMAWML